MNPIQLGWNFMAGAPRPVNASIAMGHPPQTNVIAGNLIQEIFFDIRIAKAVARA
jgi:hypothetical protein